MIRALLAGLALLPALAIAGPNDLVITQRNFNDTGLAPNRLVAPPANGADGIMGYVGATQRPIHWGIGPGLSVSGGVLSAMAAAPTWDAVTGKPVFAPVATSGAYADLSGRPALFSGAYADLSGTPSTFPPAAHTHAAGDITSGTLAAARIPALPISQTTGLQAALDAKLSSPSGTASQYLRGDGTLAAFPVLAPVATAGTYSSLTGIPSTFAPAAHTQAWSTITATPTTLAGYGISDGVTQAALTSSLGGYATTTALTAGLATKLNTPTGTTAQYVRGDGSLATLPAAGTGTVTSINAGTGLAGGTITNSGTISLPATGTAGTYANVTTDAQGRVTAGTTRSQAAATRALNTAFQVSATRDADVRYSIQCTVTASIAGGQNCDVILEIASDAAFTQNVQTVGIVGQGQTYTLAIAIQGVQPQTQQVIGYVPAGYYVRIRTASNTGTPAFAYRAGQEILK